MVISYQMVVVRSEEVLVAPPCYAYKAYSIKYAIVNDRCSDYLCFMSRKPAYPVKKLVGMTEEMSERISDYRFGNRLGSENEAIRQLIEKGLAAAEAADK